MHTYILFDVLLQKSNIWEKSGSRDMFQPYLYEVS